MTQLKTENLVLNNHIDKYKDYFLADPGYDSKALKTELEKEGYKRILIPQNKRNIKDIKKIKRFTDEEKNIYKKRLKIENTFCKMKNNRRICMRYDSKIENFMGFVYLSLIKLLR